MEKSKQAIDKLVYKEGFHRKVNKSEIPTCTILPYDIIDDLKEEYEL